MGRTPRADCLDPLDFILHEHDRHQVLCDLLEEIADRLPDGVDRKKARQAVDIMKFELPIHHRMEEEALFPLLIKYATLEDNANEMVDRLIEEHVVDESFADELIEFLELLSQGKLLKDANMFGYMLRGFFENYRRHLMWENSIVLPLARRRLPADGLRELTRMIAELHTDGSIQGTRTSQCEGNCVNCKKTSKP